jgi:hypothetical protein
MIDFNEICARVTIEDILADCGFYPKGKRMPCPIHGGNNPTAFSFNEHTFFCFNCGASGGLLDLAEILRGTNRQEARKYLADKAGIRYEIHPADGQDKIVRPARRRPIIGESADVVELRVILKGLEALREHYTRQIRNANRRLREGVIDLPRYHAVAQYAEYALEELDAQVIKVNYEINIKKGAMYANNIGSK